jgi:Leucine-rich repeat (LRR) protein
VLVAAAAIRIHAQQDHTPIFRAGTTLVEFTIVATDQNGKPITDLKQEDVAILQNGKPQPVAFFDLKARRSARTPSKRTTSRSRRAFSPTGPSTRPVRRATSRRSSSTR